NLLSEQFFDAAALSIGSTMAALKFFDFAFVAMVTGMLIIVSDYSAAKEATYEAEMDIMESFAVQEDVHHLPDMNHLHHQHHRHDDEDDLDEHLHLDAPAPTAAETATSTTPATAAPSVPKFRSRFGGFSGTGSYRKKLSRRRCRKYRFTGRKLVCVSYFNN
ncbi:hypothetical protein BOX15_Mlig011470g2, partial [Macrostomum lignano]